MMKGIVVFLSCLACSSTSVFGQNWQFLGGPAGTMNAHDIFFTKSGRLIVSTSKGISYSDNDGSLWHDASGVSGDSVTSFMQRMDGELLATCPGGLIESTDGGENWSVKGSPLPFGCKICESPIDSALYYVNGKSIFRSSDGGTNWSRVWTGDSTGSLVVTDSGWIYVSTLKLEFLLSKDNGKSFHPISLGVGAWYGTGYDSSKAIAFSMLPDRHGSFYFAVHDPSIWGDGIFDYRPNERNSLYFVASESPWGWDFPLLGVTDNGDLFYDSNQYLQEYSYSSERSANLTHFNSWQMQLARKVVAYDDVLAISYGSLGAFESFDGGKSWGEISSNYNDCRSVYISGQGDIYAGTYTSAYSGRLYKSTDGGMTWLDISPYGYMTSFLSVTPLSDGNLIAAGSGGVFVYDPQKSYWTQSIDITSASSQYVSRSGVVYVGDGNNGIYVSTDNGATWTESDSGLPKSTFIAFGESPTGRVFTAASPSGVYYTDNHGQSWTAVNGGPLQYEKASGFAYKEDTVFAATTGGVVYSTDNGIDWIQAGGPYGGAQTVSVAPNGDLLATVPGNGLYMSTNNGSTWTQFSDGLTNTSVTDIVFNNIGRLYAATGSGIFSSDAYETGPNSGVKSFSLQQNFPNPFNPSTIIMYKLASDSHVTLQVYDVLGRLVNTLVNEDQRMGNYLIEFNGTRYASGVYFYRLQAGSYSVTKKMLLMK